MKARAFALSMLAILPASAQAWEVGLFGGQQSCRSITNTPYRLYPGPPVDMASGSRTVLGLRVGRDLWEAGPVLLQGTLGYQPKATSTIRTSPGYQDPLTFSTSGTEDFTASHASAGVMLRFKAFVALGAGVEYRFEQLGISAYSARYNRAWARVTAEIGIPGGPVLHPFVGLEAALPLASTSSGFSTMRTDDILRSLAPSGQMGLYGGVRF